MSGEQDLTKGGVIHPESPAMAAAPEVDGEEQNAPNETTVDVMAKESDIVDDAAFAQANL